MAKRPVGGNATDYDADAIDVNLGLDAVRAGPQVYIGNPDSDGMAQCVKEPIDNFLDEAEHPDVVNKYGGVSVEADGTIWVYDAGRGIPVEIHKTSKVSTLTTVLTVLSAGGKMRTAGGGYNKSAGVHGMGVAITNAMSAEFTAWTHRGGQWYRQDFAKGKENSKVVKSVAPVVPLAPEKLAKRKRGTVIRFKLDKSVFDKGSALNLAQLESFLQLSAYLHPTISIYYATSKKSKKFSEPTGLAGYLESICAKHKAEPISELLEIHNADLDLALRWTDNDADLVASFVNGSPTVEGGTHVNGLQKAIAEALAKHAGVRANYKPEDLRVGLAGVLNFGQQKPRFTTQNKTKLATPEAAEVAYQATKPALDKYFATHKQLAKDIIARAVEIRNIMTKATMDKKATSKLKDKKESMAASGKLADCTRRDRKTCELFLVEGDSAGGTAKNSRDNEFQAVLPLRGKIPNAFKGKQGGAAIFENREVRDILRSIGYEPGAKDPLAKLRFGKLILLMDPDVDGGHIVVLVLAFFQKVLPALIERGMIYMVDAPLYNAQHKGQRYFGASLEEVLAQLPKGVKLKEGVQRIKGWGEVSADSGVMQKIAFDLRQRKLTKIKPVEGDELRKFASMVGENPADRRELVGV